ncbi:hypothetical protein V2W45_1236642, partial [Cenococcum geophilum]
WLYHERNLKVNYTTIHRILKKKGWLRKAIRRIAQGRNSQLRELYYDNMRQFLVDIVAFLNKAIFNEKTGWRTRGRALVGKEACY